MAPPLGNSEEINTLATQIAQQIRTVEAGVHKDHHAFIETFMTEYADPEKREQKEAVYAWVAKQMEREEKRSELWTKVQTSVIGWIVLGIFAAVGTAVWQYIQSQIHKT
jgi:hypothetical protein